MGIFRVAAGGQLRTTDVCFGGRVELTATAPFHHDYGLRDQIPRAAVSGMSNIAEGFRLRLQSRIRTVPEAKALIGGFKRSLIHRT